MLVAPTIPPKENDFVWERIKKEKIDKNEY